MKRILLYFTCIIGFFLSSCSPNAKEILKKSFDKCQSIENGYYEMTKEMKNMSGSDTSLYSFKCHFKKIKEDTIFSAAFHYQYYKKGRYNKDILYTGEEVVRYSTKDSTGTIMTNKLWADDILKYRHNYTLFTPLVAKDSNPTPDFTDLNDSTNVFTLIGKETIENKPCYHISMSYIPANVGMLEVLSVVNEYWIGLKDYIPIQYSTVAVLKMNNDTMYQYEKYRLTHYELDMLADEIPLRLSSIPAFVNLQDYAPKNSPELLEIDTFAPDFTLLSLEDDSISLSDFKGELILMDFFYKSCYPCLLALPTLQSLHEKYENKGLRVIGINPYDTKQNDDIDQFLKKRGINYPILLDAKDVAKDYHVSGYPTIYLIDQHGKIIFSKVGYGEGLDLELEKMIKENL